MVGSVRMNNVAPFEGRKRRKRRVLEAPIHRSILNWLQLVLPGALVAHVPNEVDASGTSVARAVAKSKSLGMVRGFPDLVVFLPDGEVVMFEVKSATGRVSTAQAAVHDRLAGLGHRTGVVRSIDDAKSALARWGIETREVKA
jgi:hypothetical protein